MHKAKKKYYHAYSLFKMLKKNQVKFFRGIKGLIFFFSFRSIYIYKNNNFFLPILVKSKVYSRYI